MIVQNNYAEFFCVPIAILKSCDIIISRDRFCVPFNKNQGVIFVARKGRIQSEIGIYHVLLRGVNVLFENDADFNEFTDVLEKYTEDEKMRIFSYVLLKNRVHLVVYASENIGKALKPICTSYARYFNRTYGENGRLFYDRFKSEPINSDEELKNVVRFVNTIAEKCGEDYDFCALSKRGKKICTGDGRLSRGELTETGITELFAEEYDSLTQDEIAGYITEICGTAPEKFKSLAKAELDEALKKLTAKRWISRAKLYGILGIQKPRTEASTAQKAPKKKKEEPKKEPEPKRQKQELSFWLL